MQSEPCHSSKTECSAKIVNGWKQTLHLRCLTEFWIRLCVTFNFYLTKLSWEILYFVVSTNAFLLKMQYSNCRVQCWIRPIMSSSEPVRLESFCSVNNKFVLYFREQMTTNLENLAFSRRPIYTRRLKIYLKKLQRRILLKKFYDTLMQWFHREFFITEFLRWDGRFTLTLVLLGIVTYLYPVPNHHQTIT